MNIYRFPAYTEYQLWKLWWFAATYGASPEKRMELLDEARTVSRKPKNPNEENKSQS